MYALELETDIKSEYIKVPEYEKLKNRIYLHKWLARKIFSNVANRLKSG